MHTATDIIKALGGPRKVSAAMSLPYTTVHGWMRHDSIPEWRWPAIMTLAVGKLALGVNDRPVRKPKAEQADEQVAA